MLFSNSKIPTKEEEVLSEKLLSIILLAATILCGGYSCVSLFILEWDFYRFTTTFFAFLIVIALYFYSKKTKNQALVQFFFTIFSVSIIGISWFLFDGVVGGTGYFYILLTAALAIIYQPRIRLLSIILPFSLILILALVEYLVPSSITKHSTNQILFFGVLANMLFGVLIIGWLIISVNAAYEKQSKKIESKNQELEKANAAKSTFLANMSHEIRTPMNGVMGMATLLNSTPLSPEQQEYVVAIEQSSSRLLKIINEILDFSKLDVEQVKIDKEPFSLLECIHEVIAINLPKAQEKGLHLDYKIAENTPLYWNGDKGKIQQILTNLIGNAIKFTSTGHVTISSYVADNSIDNQQQLQFDIVDTGIGIPEIYRANLFDIFTQVDDSTTRSEIGTGLGLSICKKLVELMSGEISFASELNKGTTFYFSIPLQLAEAPTTIVAKKSTAILKTKKSSKNINILLVEDDRINQLLAERVLNKMGYAIQKAVNGQEAIEKIAQESFDIVLMDLQMPIMDGMEATKFIRQQDYKQPIIIAMTANAMERDKNHCMEIGMNDFISKPIDVDLLEKTLLKWKS